MKKDEFEKRFADLTQELVQVFYDHAEGDERIKRIFIFVGIDELSEVNGFYEIEGDFVTTADVLPLVGVDSLSNLEVLARLEPKNDILERYLDLFEEADRKVPSIMKMVYDVGEEDLEMALDYHKIGEDETVLTDFSDWLEDVSEGGAPLPPPGKDLTLMA